MVQPTAPIVDNTSTADSDGNGVSDAAEVMANGIVDSDGDRIPDFVEEAAFETNNEVLPIDSAQTRFVTSEPGLELRLGITSLESSITTADFRTGLTPNQEFTNAAGEVEQIIEDDVEIPEADRGVEIVDFEVINLPVVGQQVQIVIPLAEPIPNNARYRKYFANALDRNNGENNNVADGSVRSGWQDFDTDARGSNSADRFDTTSVEGSVCPDFSSAVWTSGLTQGDNCLRLTIRDGGPNDADNAENTTIADPGTIVGGQVPDVNRSIVFNPRLIY